MEIYLLAYFKKSKDFEHENWTTNPAARCPHSAPNKEFPFLIPQGFSPPCLRSAVAFFSTRNSELIPPKFTPLNAINNKFSSGTFIPDLSTTVLLPSMTGPSQPSDSSGQYLHQYCISLISRTRSSIFQLLRLSTARRETDATTDAGLCLSL